MEKGTIAYCWWQHKLAITENRMTTFVKLSLYVLEEER